MFYSIYVTAFVCCAAILCAHTVTTPVWPTKEQKSFYLAYTLLPLRMSPSFFCSAVMFLNSCPWRECCSTKYQISTIKRNVKKFRCFLFLMIHLSFQAREQAVRLLWFAATGCPFPPLLPWKHMLDEAEPGTGLKYMISKLFAFPCKESFTSCFYKTLCEEEMSLGRGSFLRCLTGVDAQVWRYNPWACEPAALSEMHETEQGQSILELVSLWLWHLGSEEFCFYVNSLL